VVKNLTLRTHNNDTLLLWSYLFSAVVLPDTDMQEVFKKD